jgi:hypothetical protein
MQGPGMQTPVTAKKMIIFKRIDEIRNLIGLQKTYAGN